VISFVLVWFVKGDLMRVVGGFFFKKKKKKKKTNVI
jgi:hypothetical protein